MAYCMITDLQARVASDILIELSDDDDAGAIDETIIQTQIDRASREIDALLSALYTTPISSPPTILKDFNAAIALKYLYGRREKQAPTPVNDEASFAVEFIKSVSEGKRPLPGVDLPEAAGISTFDIGPKASRLPDIMGDGSDYESEWLDDVES